MNVVESILAAQNVYPGLHSLIGPRPQPGTHDENAVYTVATYIRPAIFYPR